MSYDELDASRDEMYDVISQELYPGHKQQAIEEFSSDCLRSYYVKNPGVMMPAVETFRTVLLSKSAIYILPEASTVTS